MATRDSTYCDTTFATNRTQAASIICCMSNEASKCVYTNLQYVRSDKLHEPFFEPHGLMEGVASSHIWAFTPKLAAFEAALTKVLYTGKLHHLSKAEVDIS